MERSAIVRRWWEENRQWMALGDALFILLLGSWFFSSPVAPPTCCALTAPTPAASLSFFSPLTTEPALEGDKDIVPPYHQAPQIVYLPIVENEQSIYLPLLYRVVSDIPVPLFPAMASTSQSLNTYIEWYVDTPSGQPLTYELYLEANTQTPRLLMAQTPLQQPYFSPGTLLPDTEYSWQVVSIAPDNSRVAGPVGTFRTMGFIETPDVEEMAVIPAGEFEMGCDLEGSSVGGCVLRKDTPLHVVYLDAYAIDKYEVTNQQYRACVAAGVCRSPWRLSSRTRPSYFYNPEYDYFPVLFVSWSDAQTYCAWKDKRLPTEAEWEKAARGPIDTRTWPWGEEFPNCTRTNFTDDSGLDWVSCVEDTTRVGSYPTGASPYGVMDIAGNVFEWVADRMDTAYQINYYAISPYANPTGADPSFELTEGPFYIIRGGSYRPRWSYTRTYHRHHGHRGGSSQLGVDVPLYRNDQVGFRCARPLDDE